MKIEVGWSVNPLAEKAVEEAYSGLFARLQGHPHMLLLHSSVKIDNEAAVRRLRALAPNVPIHGGTSCNGVLTGDGYHTRDGSGLGLLGIRDPEGSYGVGIYDLGEDAPRATQSALDQALAQADRAGEVPAVILISSPPGQEEFIIRAIERHVGSGVPIIGGTAADNDMSGQWQQFGGDRVARQAVSIAALFPSADIGYAFHSGYEPTEHRGRVTRAAGRVLYEIDHRPAARVYNEWTDGLISAVLPGGGSLVPTASMTPLGNPVGRVGDVPYYRLAYPVEVVESEALALFTDVQQDGEIVLMTGTRDSLVSRAGRVAAAAIDNAPFQANQVQGALVLFCTGCMLAVQDRLQESAENLRHVLHDAPFLCAFTLGEQGCFIGGENRHANLMIAVLAFGPPAV